MTSIAPSTPPTTTGASATTPAAPAAGTNAVVTQLPPQLQNSGPGTVISGTVIGRDNQGQTLLQTDAGVVAFKTPAQLATGAQVTLQVQVAGSQLQAVILAARAPAATATGAPIPQTPATVVMAPAAAIVTSIGTGPIVTATVIGPAAGAPPPGLLASGPAAPTITAAPAPAAGAAVAQVIAPAVTAGAAFPAVSPQPASPATVFGPPVSPSSIPTAVIVSTIPSGSAPTPQPVPTTSSPPAATAAPPQSANPSPAPPIIQPAGILPAAASLPATPAQAPLLTTNAAPASPAPATAIARYAAVAGGTAAPIATAPVPTAQPHIPATTSVPVPTTEPATVSHPGSPLPQSPLALPSAQAGTHLQMRYIGPAATPVVPGALVATMLGQTPTGQAIFDTALGRVALTLPAGISAHQAGSLVTFQILNVAARPAVAGMLGQPASRTLTLGHEWPALKAVLAVLSETDAPLARQILDVGLPRPSSPRFLGQVLSFIANPAQDVRALLGEAALLGLERAGRGDLALRLDADLREAARANAASTDWRMFFVPVADTHEMRQLRLFTRRRAPAGGKNRDGGGRFIVEVDFDDLGPLQIDGLVQKPRIDLILRSHVELPQDMRMGIIGIFEKTCGAAGLNGQIFFQAVPSFPVSPLEEMVKAQPGVDV